MTGTCCNSHHFGGCADGDCGCCPRCPINPTSFRVRIDQCRFTLEQLSAAHLFPAPHTLCEQGPIVVSRLNDGNVFVHNGRHRVLRALIAGVEWVDAVSLYPDDDTTPPNGAFPTPRTIRSES